MKRKIYITAAPTGSVPRYIEPTESRFISDIHLEKYLPSIDREKFIAALVSNGWSRAEAGGIRSVEPTSCISKSLLSNINDQKTIRKIVLHLTSYGWEVNEQGDLYWLYPKLDTYIPKSLLSMANEYNPLFTEILLSQNWEICGSGYYQCAIARTVHLPISVEQIVQEANACYAAGAAIVHFHTREKGYQVLNIPEIDFKVKLYKQRNYIDVEQYEQIIPQVFKSTPTGIINVSTSVRGDTMPFDSPLRRAHLKKYAACNVIPDIASFSIGPVVFSSGGGYENPPDFLTAQMQHMQMQGVRPEIEIFNKTILNNVLNDYHMELSTAGSPVLFMLIIGVEQFKSFADRTDDSLLPREISKQIIQLLQNQNVISKHTALQLVLEYLLPIVKDLRCKYSACKISILTAGIMQCILSDLAVALDLDGVRVGMEDTLSIEDQMAPSGMRHAKGSAEQVKIIKCKLEKLDYHVLTAEELREEINMPRPEVALFRSVAAKLAAFSQDVINTSKLPSVESVAKLLDSEYNVYQNTESQFVDDVLSLVTNNMHAEQLSKIIEEYAYAHGVYIRYFIEEKDRYDNFAALNPKDLYLLQNLNYMRELLHERNLDYTLFEQALLAKYEVDFRIQPNQFKGALHRFIEFLTDISCRYNTDRTGVHNYCLRQDSNYSATMAILFHCSKQMMLRLRKKSASPSKTKGLHSFVVGDQVQLKHDWLMIPSTTTTNYPLGLKLANGLAETFYKFIAGNMHDASKLSILAFAHSGCDADNADIVEASMLYNRFANNTDHENKFYSYSAGLLTERIFLPRIVLHPEKLLYDADGHVQRNSDGLPVYMDLSPAKRIEGQKIKNLPFWKLLAHSSGITTAQQIDNMLLSDMRLLGYSLTEQKEIFSRAIIISFASASDVLIDNMGTAVIDVTACNDIRSLAGTTTSDYICQDQNIRNEFKQAVAKFRIGEGKKYYPNAQANVVFQSGKQGKRLLRVKDVYLFDDPLRLHDGHSIMRYLMDSPEFVKTWIKFICDMPQNMSGDELLEYLYNLNSAQESVK